MDDYIFVASKGPEYRIIATSNSYDSLVELMVNIIDKEEYSNFSLNIYRMLDND